MIFQDKGKAKDEAGKKRTKWSQLREAQSCGTQSCRAEILKKARDLPGGAAVKNPLANAGDTGLSPGQGRSHMPWSN